MVINFFKQIGLFLQNENDLSDITCAMCHSSENFKKWFIAFFFPNLDVSKILSIEREVPDEKEKHSRVDLMIRVESDELPYLIEVKIYDRQHHFGQYEEAYGVGRERLGYITNYICYEGKKLGYDVKTWNEWYSILESHILTLPEGEEKSLCSGYLVYLKQVCGFANLVKSLSADKDTLEELMKTMKASLVACYEDLELHITSTIFADYVYTFQYKAPNGDLLGGWLGLIDKENSLTIGLGFQSNLAKTKPIYSLLKQNGLVANDIWSENIGIFKYSGKCQVVPMSSFSHTEFTKLKHPEEQIALIREFIRSTLTFLNSMLY